MRIKRINIKNFKGFQNVSFDLESNFTVFIGDNAKGKTTVLDAIAIAVGCFLRGIDVAKQEARGIEKREIRIHTIDGQPRPQIPVEIEAFGEVGGIQLNNGWKRTVNKLSKKTTATFVHAKNIENIAVSMLNRSRKEGNVTFPVIAYHGTGRLWAVHEEKKSPYKKQGEGVEIAYLRCLSPKSSSKEFLSWYKTYEDEIRKFDLDSDKVLLKTFNKAIMAMIPDNHWTEMAYSFKDEDIIGLFNKDNNTEKLLYSQLSDGYRNLIGMVADIAFRCIKLNPHLGALAVEKSPGIILIDELDLHLHPKWQKQIVQDLKEVFKNMQFVATTHSPFIIQSLKSSELINLDNISQLDTDPYKYSIEEITTSEMGVQNVLRSKQFLTMQNLAKEYFNLIRDKADSNKIQAAKLLLDKLRVEYNSDPAYVALLESEFPH
ncbi:MAG: AAA family ATPase [Bacteroidales bacterium]|nr:AAA family ATPase [Bacteroidales bacterium]